MIRGSRTYTPEGDNDHIVLMLYVTPFEALRRNYDHIHQFALEVCKGEFFRALC